VNDPYQVLGIGHEASEAEIRNRYLALVREFPPDRAAERFAEIRAAFDQLRDPLVRLERQVFTVETHDSFDALRADLTQRLRSARIPVEALLALAECR
jgi:curved DNA-binding protein CbpA